MDEDNKDKFDNKEEDTLKSDQERKSESDSTETLNTQDTNNELEKSNENDNLTENPENLQSQDEIVEQNISATNNNKEEDISNTNQDNQSDNDSTDNLNPQDTYNNQPEVSNENDISTENQESLQSQDVSDEKIISSTNNNEEQKKEHEVIHKKDDRLHIYIRQDKYKGELKSKNWVGRLYIDGKQKISSSGTQNLEEAIPILEKWFDDVHAESEKLKKLSDDAQENQTTTQEQANVVINTEEISNPTPSTDPTPAESTQNINNQVEPAANDLTTKNKVSNILGKFKNLKFKKPSLKGIKLPNSPVKNKNNALSKVLDFFKSKIIQQFLLHPF